MIIIPKFKLIYIMNAVVEFSWSRINQNIGVYIWSICLYNSLIPHRKPIVLWIHDDLGLRFSIIRSNVKSTNYWK